MISSNLRCALGIVTMVLMVWACIPTGKRPFLQVQMCVVNDNGLSKFKNILQEIARSENMIFVDGSKQTQEQFEYARQNNKDYNFTMPVIHFGVERDDRMGLTASNVGLNSYQIAIGFGSGDNAIFVERDSTIDARKFADRVVNELKIHWPVETVPAGTGASPMKSCKSLG